MISRFQRLTSFWKQLHISPAGKVVLINSVLLIIPSYTLVVYHMPDTIFDQLAEINWIFLRYDDGNNSGLLLVSWNRITLDKSEGDLAIRNLRHLHTAYFSKNSLKFFNKGEAFLVDILDQKYGFVHPWCIKIPPKCSLFSGLFVIIWILLNLIWKLISLILILLLFLEIPRFLKFLLISNQLLLIWTFLIPIYILMIS